MALDVTTETAIDRPIHVVASYAADPSNAPTWYSNIEAVRWETDPPVQLGTKVEFAVRFLGQRLEYTYEVVELVPDDCLVMRTAQGPFPMETTYVWRSMGPETTHMTLRNRGEPSGFFQLAAPVMATAVRRANRKDLALLKRTLESS